MIPIEKCSFNSSAKNESMRKIKTFTGKNNLINLAAASNNNKNNNNNLENHNDKKGLPFACNNYNSINKMINSSNNNNFKVNNNKNNYINSSITINSINQHNSIDRGSDLSINNNNKDYLNIKKKNLSTKEKDFLTITIYTLMV